MASNPNEVRKRSTTFESNIHKKVKLDSGKVELPNEIWTKIMHHLSTKDIFKNFGLVSKRFHSLIGGIKYLQVKNIDRVYFCKEIIEIVKNSKALIELDLDFHYSHAKPPCSVKLEYFSNFVKEAINLCHRLKSVKISGCCYVNFDFMLIIKKLENHLEHLTLDKVQTTPEVLIKINKLKSLKSLKLSRLNYYPSFFVNKVNMDIVSEHNIFNPQVIHALANNSMKLESVDFYYVSKDHEVSEALNKFFCAKKDTLRKIRLFNSRSHWNVSELPINSYYENLNLCKNLEDLSGLLIIRDFQHTQLKRLQIENIVDSNCLSMLSQMNRINLEHIEIIMKEDYFDAFVKLQFPALKYLVIQLNNQFRYIKATSFKTKNSNTLIKNSPNLEKIQFKGPYISQWKRCLIKIFQEHGPITINTIYPEKLKEDKSRRINPKNEIHITCSLKNT